MNEFARTLKKWRKIRRFSQLDLATEAGISARHLSFLETNRAHPSRSMVLRLSETLQLPLDARNQILNHAGFAAQYGERRWVDDELVPVRQAINRMLQNHMPYPGLALDRFWNITEANQTALTLFGRFGVGIGDNLVDLMMSETVSQVIENWPEVAKSAAARLRIESSAQGGIDRFEKAAAHLAKAASGAPRPTSPVIPTEIKLDTGRLSMFATIAQIGTPEDVVLDDMKVELYFPTNDETALAFEAMSSTKT